MATLGKYYSSSGRVDEIKFNDDVKYSRTALEYYPPGIDSKPFSGRKGLVHDLGNKKTRAMSGVSRPSSESIVKNGESRLYNSFGAEIYLKEDGTVGINGDSKSFMTYEEFANHWNNLLNWLTAHTHTDSVLGQTTSPLEPIGPEISDITDSKTTTVFTDG